MDNNEQDMYEIKKSPYQGINNPEIRKQYEKEYNKTNYSFIISLILIIVCSLGYCFLISDTFTTIKYDEVEEEEKSSNEKIEVNESNVVIENIDEIDVNTLQVIDNTNKISNESVIDASYIIKELNYNNESISVPYININSSDAQSVNEEIKNNYKIWAKESAKFQKAYSNTSLNISQVINTQYKVFKYEDILSVVISFCKRENSMETYQYYAYTFNLSSNELLITPNSSKSENTNINDQNNYGKKLSFQEILAKLNLSYETIDNSYKEILHQYSGEYGDIKNIDDTLNLYNEEITNKTLNAFIDNEGKLNIISKIYTPLYENGTYRIFSYDGNKFESVTNLNKENNESISNNENENQSSLN